MSPSYTKFSSNVQPEGAFTVLAAARRLSAVGKEVIELEIGDSPFPSPDEAIEAGAYGIQGFGGSFVASLSGSYSAVMGLPLYETTMLLALAGIHPSWKENRRNE